MMQLARTERHLLARWWWTVDRPLLAGLALLASAGVIFVFAASPPVAHRLDLPSLHFVLRHTLYLAPALLVLFGTSLLAPRGVWRLALAVLLLGILMLILTLLTGAEIKGARRWLSVGGFMLQPSELIKPALAVVVGAMLARSPGVEQAKPVLILTALIVLLILAQPDVGMTLTVACIVASQLFIAGLPWLLVGLIACAGGLMLWSAYVWFPHVTERIDRFIDPSSGDHYQVATALEAIRGAAWFGSGPGEGEVKYRLPDAHSDFVFAVIAEEFGLVACLALIGLFTFIVVRGLEGARQRGDRFALIASVGLLTHFGLQAIVNVGVNLGVLPATGMTLPFVSYGGSSLFAIALGMGMLLALNRRRPGAEATP
ncbi:MAG: putative peptidoglycan glycosyltransferase FtsW [Geminicoccaceae bacterium]|nr:putative peptidoglycan glycosyltransferase FtsW [Geminicoccaceae bacterium]